MIGPPLYIIALFPGIKTYRQHMLPHLSQRHLYMISLVHVRWVQFKMAVFSSNIVLYDVFVGPHKETEESVQTYKTVMVVP